MKSTVEPVERARGRELELKRLHPITLEVDGVGEHEVSGGLDVVSGDHGVDEVVGGLLHPLVDHPHSGLGLHTEAELPIQQGGAAAPPTAAREPLLLLSSSLRTAVKRHG